MTSFLWLSVAGFSAFCLLLVALDIRHNIHRRNKGY